MGWTANQLASSEAPLWCLSVQKQTVCFIARCNPLIQSGAHSHMQWMYSEQSKPRHAGSCHLIFNCSHSDYNQISLACNASRVCQPDTDSITFPELSRQQRGLCISLLSFSLLSVVAIMSSRIWEVVDPPLRLQLRHQARMNCNWLAEQPSQTAQSQPGPGFDTGWQESKCPRR